MVVANSHMRTYPFVSQKHNMMEALGHCGLLLLYAITLILRNGDDSQWEREWFPKQGCKSLVVSSLTATATLSSPLSPTRDSIPRHDYADGWFIIFIFMAVLPAPTVYYWYQENRADKTLETEFGEIDSMQTDNPLASEEDPDAASSAALAMPRSRLARLQREAKDAESSRKENSELRKQVEKLKKELKRQSSSPETPGSSFEGDTALLDKKGTEAAVKMQVDMMKGFVGDEGLSEAARESAKQALGSLVASQISLGSLVASDTEQTTTLNSMRSKADFNNQFVGMACSDEMVGWLRSHRLLHHASAIIAVTGTYVYKSTVPSPHASMGLAVKPATHFSVSIYLL